MNLKSIKKTASVILAAAMLFGAGFTNVFAGAIPSDQINPDETEDVSLTIYMYESDEKIEAEKDKDKYPNNGAQQNIIGAVGIGGVVFKIEKVTLNPNAKLPRPDEPTNPADYIPVTTEDDKFSNTGTTDASGKLVFSSKAAENTVLIPSQGFYKVSEVKSGSPGTPFIKDFIVSLPMPDPANNQQWLYDVYAYPKSEVIYSIEKDLINREKAGNVLKWEFALPIPQDITGDSDSKKILKITDKLDPRLRYLEKSIIAQYTTKDSFDRKSLDIADFKLTPVIDNGVQTLAIEITEAGFVKLKDVFKVEGDVTPGLFFSFETITNIDPADTTGLAVIYNGGKLEYTNSDNNPYTPAEIKDEDKPSEKVYGIDIHKTNVNSENLAGAKFLIYTVEKNNEDKEEKIYLKNPKDPGSSGDNENRGKLWEVTTESDGKAHLYGLVAGIYYLEEITAPTGYNKLEKPIEVVVDEKTANAGNILEVIVTNRTGFDLPETGGAGTIIFTAGGMAIIVSGVALLIYAQRKKNKKDAEI